MKTTHIERTENEHHFETMPTGLKNAVELSDAVGLPAEKLLEYANAFICPHFRVNGGEPLFQAAETKRWIAKHLLQRFEGKETLEIMLVVPAAKAWDKPPAAIRHVDGLCQVPLNIEPGVYFLCDDSEVVYVGQSLNPSVRIQSHRDKQYTHAYFVPCPKSELNILESKMIHALQPKLNGSFYNGTKCAPVSERDCARLSK